MQIIKKIKYIISVIFLFLLLSPVYASSFQAGLDQTAEGTGHISNKSFFQSNNLPEAVGKFIKIFYIGIIGIAFLILIIYAGITWMTAKGDEEKITKAKNILKNAIIGLIVALSAYALGSLVFGVVGLLKKT